MIDDWDALIKKVGQESYQESFETLFKISLVGMNIGTGENPQESGEIGVLKYLQQLYQQQNQLIIFDVGANVGKYSKLLNDIFQEKAVIHAFEPSQKAFLELLVNNSDRENIILNNFGLSDRNQKRLLYTNYNGSGLASVYQRRLNHYGINMEIQEEIEVKTLDFYCSSQSVEHIHFLKLDVEGHELNVLLGAEHMLANGAIDFIQFEFGGCNIDSRTFLQDFFYLLSKDFKIYRILKDGLILLPIYKETYEIFTTTNFLAEKK
jgi:FkbM family methyltransferase